MDNKAITANSTQRNSSIELLRIIMMIMIIFHHYASYSGFSWDYSRITAPHLWYVFMLMGGKVGVNVFVLISGYFLIETTNYRNFLKKALKLWAEVCFYSVSLYSVFALTGIVEFEPIVLLKAFLPIAFVRWWFPSTYFILFLVHPFLNEALRALGKKKHQLLIVVLGVLWSVLPTVIFTDYQQNKFLWFVFLYIIAGYLKLYGTISIPVKKRIVLLISAVALTFMLIVVVLLLAKNDLISYKYEGYFTEMNKINILLLSLAWFGLFTNIRIKNSKLINMVASSTFGVYLLHEHYVVRSLIWFFFDGASYRHSITLIPYSIMVVLSVFCLFVLIDMLRKNLIEKPLMKALNTSIDSATDRIIKLTDKVIEMVFKN